MSINSRNKGKVGEREAAAWLRELFACNARRGQQYAGGPDSPDVADAIPGVHFEVKRRERLSISKAMQQADDERADDEMPCVLHRRNREPWLATVKLSDLRFLADCIQAVVDNGPDIVETKS